MRNFNTNQTRHFYTNGIAVGDVTTSATLGTVKPDAAANVEKIYFAGTNADGLKYRSDTIDIDKIVSVKKTAAAKMAPALLKHTIVINADEFANVAALAGKTVKLMITVHQVFDYDDSNTTVFTVEHKVAAAETATNFYKALADAITKAMPKPDKEYPYFTVTSSANNLVITEAVQKYVRGKLTGEPVHISVAFKIVADTYKDDEYVAWGKDTVEKASTVVPANYILADLEYFAYGERGDYYRGNNWPNDVEPTYAINPKSSAEYDVLTVEYYWAGGAENVQKSPRLIQIAGASDGIATLYDSIVKLLPAAKSEIPAAVVGG